MRPSGHKTWVEVSRTALLHNIREIKRVVSPTRLMCVVKSNAYGHGLTEVAEICHNAADWFGVDSATEAFILRRKKIRTPILILGYVDSEDLERVIKQNISFVIYHASMLQAAIAAAKKVQKRARIHLKLETGLTRQGVDEASLPSLLMLLKGAEAWVELEGVSTHFANVEDTEHLTYARAQLSRFEMGLTVLARYQLKPKWKHVAASAAALLMPESRIDFVRSGISLYGLWPSEKTRHAFLTNARSCDLRPALTWKTIVVQLKDVVCGTPVSYGLTEKVRRDSCVAVLPIGYWDGYDRVGMSRRAEVLIRGRRCRVLGRVCMNMCMVDVTDVPAVTVGDEVVLLGKQKQEEVSAEEIAHHADTISYEVITRINPLIRRIIVD